MANISIPELQEIAVQCTSDFFNNNTPLNESLAKQASLRDLNSDQLQRAIEATNTLTYLKSIDVAKDRTSEFPVANYSEIVKLACIPESLQKIAEFETAKVGPDLVKQAEDAMFVSEVSVLESQKPGYIYKLARITGRALEDAKIDLSIQGEKLIKIAKEIKADPQAIEHLSASSATSQEFTKIASLIFGSELKRKDFVTGMFKSAEISTAQSFVDNFRQAQDLFNKVNHLEKSHTKLAEMEKLAFLPALAGLANATRFTGAMKNSGASSITGMAASSAAKAVIGTGVGAVKMVGKSIAGVGGGTAKLAKAKVQNALAGTKLGKELKVPTAVVPKSTTARLAGAATITGAAFDASMYTPKVDPANDRSGDVWNALQKR